MISGSRENDIIDPKRNRTKITRFLLNLDELSFREGVCLRLQPLRLVLILKHVFVMKFFNQCNFQDLILLTTGRKNQTNYGWSCCGRPLGAVWNLYDKISCRCSNPLCSSNQKLSPKNHFELYPNAHFSCSSFPFNVVHFYSFRTRFIQNHSFPDSVIELECFLGLCGTLWNKRAFWR